MKGKWWSGGERKSWREEVQGRKRRGQVAHMQHIQASMTVGSCLARAVPFWEGALLRRPYREDYHVKKYRLVGSK